MRTPLSLRLPMRLSIGIALTIAIAACQRSCEKSVALVNTKVDHHGVIVTDGFATEFGSAFSSYAFLGTLTSVGNRAGAGEIGAFGAGHGPTLKAVDWATSPPIVDVPVSPRVPLALTIWILRAPYATQRTKELADVATTEGIFAQERFGVFFNIVDTLDVTANPSAATYLQFDCSQRAAMQKAIGKHGQRVNVYVVNTVNVNGTYASTNGNACGIGSDFVAIGWQAGSSLLSHELGHDLALTHTDELSSGLKARFDGTNVMWSFSSGRLYLTEGQTFRAHMTAASFFNTSPGKPRLGEPIRDCGAETLTKACPSIKKRLWADGSFGPE
jgi:hypothetical protein